MPRLYATTIFNRKQKLKLLPWTVVITKKARETESVPHLSMANRYRERRG